jgi:hypothetical protein
MKNMKKTILTVSIIAFLVSCNNGGNSNGYNDANQQNNSRSQSEKNNDNNPSFNENDLIGKWTLIADIGENNERNRRTMVFKTNKRIVEINNLGESKEKSSFEFDAESSVLNIIDDTGERESIVLTILNSNEILIKKSNMKLIRQ